jgi:hypothetical protein
MRLGRLHPGRVALHRLGCLVLALGAFASLLLSGSAAAAGSDRRMHDEIQYLLLSVERSGCEFYRNGSWHPGPEARAHLTRKY